jgi:hypothetical protein
MALEAILASTLLPAGVDLIKGLFSAAGRRFVGLSVDDQVKLQNLEVERLKVISQLDNPNGTPSQWVIDLRASFRYIAAAAVILTAGAICINSTNPQSAATALDILGMPFGFIFGERMYLGFKGTMNK